MSKAARAARGNEAVSNPMTNIKKWRADTIRYIPKRVTSISSRNSPLRTSCEVESFHFTDCRSTINIPTLRMFLILATMGEVAYIPANASPEVNGAKNE